MLERRPHAFNGFFDGGIGQSHDDALAKPDRVDIGFDLARDCLDATQNEAVDFGNHVTTVELRVRWPFD